MDRVVHAPFVFTASAEPQARSPNCPPVEEGEQIHRAPQIDVHLLGAAVRPLRRDVLRRPLDHEHRGSVDPQEVVGCRLLDRVAELPVPERAFGLQLGGVRGRTVLRALGGICGMPATEGWRDDAVRITALLCDGLRYGAGVTA
ncbi:hypothetical protein [Streptomyces sp. NPDC058086]|uniref:hypothetical protein n=1 Tax=Streptomyces sp. NPDC058086 TaxID=3346334 RepID=UPI0036E0D2C8